MEPQQNKSYELISGGQLIMARAFLRWSVKDLAERSSVSQSTINGLLKLFFGDRGELLKFAGLVIGKPHFSEGFWLFVRPRAL